MRSKRQKLSAKVLQKHLDKLNRDLPDYCSAWTSRHGQIMVFFRRRGRKFRIWSDFYEEREQFSVEYALCMNDQKPLKPGTSPATLTTTPRSVRGASEEKTWRWACQRYFAESAKFASYSDRDQGVRRRVLESTFDEPIAPGEAVTFGDVPLKDIQTKAILILQQRKTYVEIIEVTDPITGETRKEKVTRNIEAANSRVKYIRAVFEWLKLYHTDLVGGRNWAKEVTYLESANPIGHPTWTLEEIEQFQRHHGQNPKALLTLAILLFAGQRRGDTARLNRSMVRRFSDGNDYIVFTQEKGRSRNPVKAIVPIIPALRHAMDRARGASCLGDFYFIAKENGQPYTKESLGNLFGHWCREAGLTNRSMHGLRKACVVRMIIDDCSPFEIMAVTGHRTFKEIERYGREYLRERAAESVFEKWLTKHGASGRAAEKKLARFELA